MAVKWLRKPGKVVDGKMLVGKKVIGEVMPAPAKRPRKWRLSEIGDSLRKQLQPYARYFDYIVDATKDFSFKLRISDYDRAVPYDCNDCVIGMAAKRVMKVDEALVGRSIAYVFKDRLAVRYEHDHSDFIGGFDNDQVVAGNWIRLKKISPSKELGQDHRNRVRVRGDQPNRPSGGDAGPRKLKRLIKTGGVRAFGGGVRPGSLIHG